MNCQECKNHYEFFFKGGIYCKRCEERIICKSCKIGLHEICSECHAELNTIRSFNEDFEKIIQNIKELQDNKVEKIIQNIKVLQEQVVSIFDID